MSLLRSLCAKALLILSGAVPLLLIAPPSLARDSEAYSLHFFDTRDHWANACIEGVGKTELMKGYLDGSFRPNGTMTRAEFAAVIVKAFPNAPAVRSAPNFSDVAPGFWGKAAIASAYERGFLTGYPGNLFKPTQAISRAQAIIIIANTQAQSEERSDASNTAVLNQYFQDAIAIPLYAKSGIAQAARSSSVVSYPNASRLRPNDNITRGEATALLCRVNEAGSGVRHYVDARYVAAFDHQFDIDGFPTGFRRPEPVLLRSFDQASSSSVFQEKIAVGDQIFFLDKGSDIEALWATDGTSAGTQRVRSLAANSEGDRPVSTSGANFLGANDKRFWLLTQQDYSAGGRRAGLWSSDGTPNGTQEVSSFSPALSSALNQAESVQTGWYQIRPFNSQMPVVIETTTETQLWMTDGKSEAGTQQMTTFPVAADGRRAFGSQQITPTDDYLFFLIDENIKAVGETTGSESIALWRTDGTPGGTRSLKTISGIPTREPMLPWKNQVYFTATTPEAGRELWVSDGTEAGTRILKDIYPGADSSEVSIIGRTETAIYMTANSPSGLALWMTEGTPESTRQVRRLGPRSQRQNLGITLYATDEGSFFFSAPTDHSESGTSAATNRAAFELWSSDGTEAGTRPVGKRLDSSLIDAEIFKNKLFFSARGAEGAELWMSDGTEAGTRQLVDLTPGETIAEPLQCPQPPAGTEFNCRTPDNFPSSTFPRNLTAQDDFLYFIGSGGRLFRTDGTSQGMELVAVLDSSGRNPATGTVRHTMERLGEQILFVTQGDRPQLWAISKAEAPARAGFIQHVSPAAFTIDYPVDWYVKSAEQDYVSLWNQQPSRSMFPPGFAKTEVHLRTITFEEMIQGHTTEDGIPARGGYDSGTVTKTERLTVDGKAAFRTFSEGGENGENTIVTLIRYSDTQTAQLVSYFTTGETENIAIVQAMHQSFRER